MATAETETDWSKLLTASQVARRLEVSTERVRQWAAKGQLPPAQETPYGRLWDPRTVEQFAQARGITRITMADVATLCHWLADRGASAQTVADAAEKPWKWHGDLLLAKAVLEHETSFTSGPVHECQPGVHDGVSGWYCAVEWTNGTENFCDWTFTAPDGYELFV